MHLITDWATERRHPSPSVPFALPNAIYFLLKFRADLSSFDHGSLEGRMELYFWWRAHGYRDYPDFEWVLREEDVAYAGQLDSETLITKYPRVVAAWMAGNAVDILDERALLAALLSDGASVGPTNACLPRFMDALLVKRRDLLAHFDPATFEGQLSLVSWWETHGQYDYPRTRWSPRNVYDQLDALVDDGGVLGIALPCFLRPLIASRGDLKDKLDLDTFDGRFGALGWWASAGRHHYPRLVWHTAPTYQHLNELVSNDLGLPIDVPRFLAPLVASRPDLAAFIDIETFSGRLAAMQWWDEHGKKQYTGLIWPTSRAFGHLSELDDGRLHGLFGAPYFLRPIIDGRPDLHALFNVDTFGGRLGAMEWWTFHGRDEYSRLHWPLDESWEELIDVADVPGQPVALPHFLRALCAERQDLRDRYDLSTEEGATALVAWWQDRGRESIGFLWQLRVELPAGERRARVVSDSTGGAPLARPRGINIVGFPQGVLGLGEDARMAAQAFQLAGAEVALVNAPMNGPARLEHSLDHLIRGDLVYDVSVFCLPPPEMVRMALEGGRRMLEAETYKIGAWPWELPHWPSAFGRAYEFVDEIWAQSRFVEAVYARLGKTKVRHMPMAVVIPEPRAIDRARFGLPHDQFLFYLMFDGNSWLTRKNPVAGVHAFKQAFGGDRAGVGLVIKAMNVREDDPTWRQVCEMAAQDARIHIVSERLNRQDTIDFMACCDAYISLHRSEGFGRVIAEAMALGQPVVATNFSGNVDFCDPETAFLVDGELVPLRPGEYLFHEGQYWCDPDVSLAAGQLVRVFGDAALRKRIAAAGRERIERDYSMAAVARAYRQRLAEFDQGAGER